MFYYRSIPFQEIIRPHVSVSATTTSSVSVSIWIFFYTGCNSDYTITGHIKIDNNIPVSPDKWIYGQDIIDIIEVSIKPGK
jgi:hypothetical protein